MLFKKTGMKLKGTDLISNFAEQSLNVHIDGKKLFSEISGFADSFSLRLWSRFETKRFNFKWQYHYGALFSKSFYIHQLYNFMLFYCRASMLKMRQEQEESERLRRELEEKVRIMEEEQAKRMAGMLMLTYFF